MGFPNQRCRGTLHGAGSRAALRYSACSARLGERTSQRPAAGERGQCPSARQHQAGIPVTPCDPESRARPQTELPAARSPCPGCRQHVPHPGQRSSRLLERPGAACTVLCPASVQSLCGLGLARLSQTRSLWEPLSPSPTPPPTGAVPSLWLPPPLPGALIPFSAPLVLTSFLQAHRCPPCPLGPRAPSRQPVPSSPSRSSSSEWDTGSPGQPVSQGQGGSEGHTDSTPKCLCSPEPRRPDGWVQHDVGHRGQRLGGLICCRRCSVLVSGTSMESD